MVEHLERSASMSSNSSSGSFKEAVAGVDWLGSDRMTRIENRKYYIRVDSYNLHQVIIATRTLY